MSNWEGMCQRCGLLTSGYIMSMYSTLLICFDCKDDETKRSDYKDATTADETAIKSGDYNFLGIGEPRDR
jgi:hypothetical protein